jgi:hypothetical protein
MGSVGGVQQWTRADQDDFAEASADARAESYEILYAIPANDNSLAKTTLSERCWNLFRRPVATWLRWLNQAL